MKPIKILSIIIPIYNAEFYLRRCLDSIISQSYKNIEIILVDDGSSDTSSFICGYYLKLDERIKYVHKTNGGSASARNTGLRLSTGDYVTFVDADDWIASDGIEQMMLCANKTNADIVMSDFTIEESNKSYVSRQCLDKLDPLELIKAMMTGRLHGSNCNKIYRRSLIVENNICFIDGADYTEDLAFNIKFLTLANKIVYLPIAYYHYCIHQTSMSHVTLDSDQSRGKDLQKVINVQDVDSWLCTHGWAGRVSRELNYYKLQAKMPFLAVITRRSCLRWCVLFPEANKAILEHNRLPILYRLELQLLVYKCINMFICLQRLKMTILKL